MWAGEEKRRLSTPLQKEPSPPVAQRPAEKEDEDDGLDIEALRRSPTRSQSRDCSPRSFFLSFCLNFFFFGYHTPLRYARAFDGAAVRVGVPQGSLR